MDDDIAHRAVSDHESEATLSSPSLEDVEDAEITAGGNWTIPNTKLLFLCTRCTCLSEIAVQKCVGSRFRPLEPMTKKSYSITLGIP